MKPDHAAAMKAAMEVVAAATADYEVAEQAARQSDRNKWAAKDRLNKAQGVVDSLLANIRKEAPYDTKWRESEKIAVHE